MITDLMMLSLYAGGRDGGVYVAGTTDVEDEVIHMIECLEDDTEFTVLAGEDQDETTRNWLTDNGYNGIATWKAGSLHFAPFGGKITDFTASKAVRHYRMPTTNRIQND